VFNSRPTMPLPRVLLTVLFALAAARGARADTCPFRLTGTNCVVDSDTTVFPTVSVIDVGDLNLKIRNGATLSIGASVTAAANLTIKAGSFFMEPSAGVIVKPDNAGHGGHLAVITTRGITLDTLGTHSATIDATASDTGGRIELTAGGDVLIQGPVKVPGVPGSGGEIDVIAQGAVTVKGTNLVQASGGSQGVGGSVTIIGGGPVLLDSSIDATGTISGGSLDLESGADFTTTTNAPLLLSSVDSGGDVLFDVRGSVTINAKIDQSGQAGVDFGGTGGELDMLVDGDITFNAPLDNSGTPPDGAGGLLDIEAGGSIIQNASAPIAAGAGDGTDSGGGEVDFSAEKDIFVGAPIDASGGGFGGGSIDIESKGTTTIAAEQNADGDDAGDITFVGLTVNVQASTHAKAFASDGTGGTIAAAGCTIGVPAGGSLDMTGSASGALLQASGLLTIGGRVSSSGGPNAFQYLNTVPVIQGGAVIQPPTTPIRNAALPTCDNLFPPPPTTTTTLPGQTTTTSSTIVPPTTSTTTTVPTPTTTIPPGTTTTSSTSFTTTSSRTTTSSTSTSSTTLVASTTSTSSTSSSVTSSSVAPSTSSTSSTTSTTRPECSAGDTCDDGESCTVDSCDAGSCRHVAKTGTDAATCVFEDLDASLTDAGSSNLGGPARANALLGKVSKARTLVEASRPLTGKKLLKKLKAADKQVVVFTKLVKKGETQKKIATPLADRLLGLASKGAAQLQQLMTP